MSTEIPRLVAWEVTRRCNLACVHCRAAAADHRFSDELSTEEGRRLLEDIASLAAPDRARGPIIVILSGGEPLLREDILDLVRHGTGLGLRMVMAPNGTLLTEAKARALVDAGLRRVSISLDAALASRHDAFRRVPGAFEGAMRGMAAARTAGLAFQINSTLTRRTVGEMEALLDLAVREGAVAWHVFLLVEIGRAQGIAEEQMTPAEYERALTWLAGRHSGAPIEIRATCAPQFQRILRMPNVECGVQNGERPRPREHGTRGCLAGTGFCFVSHRGILSPCGYLEIDCGSVRREGFARAWRDSPIFRDLRDPAKLRGKCGACEHRAWCGGCRARAYARTGDYLAEEPCCLYTPRG
jgi:heme b synthase